MKIYFLFATLLLRPYTPKYNYDYPDVRRDESQVDDYHGTLVKDPYRWLEDLDSSETQTFIEAQNRLTQPYLRRCPYRHQVRERLTVLMNHTEVGLFKKKGGRYFFTENDGIQNQKILYTMNSLSEDPKLLLDPNRLSTDGMRSIMAFYPSPDGKVVGYKLSKKGADLVTIHFIHVESRVHFKDRMADTKYTSLSWTVDSKGVFYSKYYSEKVNGTEIIRRPLCYHTMGTDQDSDVVVVDFSESNPTWSNYAEVSHGGKYLMVYIEDELGPVQIHYIDLEAFLKDLQPFPKLLPVVTTFEAEYYYITNDDQKNFMYLTNLKAPNWRIVTINLAQPQESAWTELIPQDPNSVLEWAIPVNKNRLVLSYLKDVKSFIQVRSLDGKTSLATYKLEPGATYGLYREVDDHEFFFAYESIITPKRIHRLDFHEHPDSPALQTYRSTSIPGFVPRDYVMTQKYYKSRDGTKIPMFLAHLKDLNVSGTTPCLLYGYGGFNTVTLPEYSTDQTLFMKNFHGVYALANIRGGGEYGRKWYDGGRLQHKQNSYDDFIAAAEYLIQNNYTSSAKLTIQGASNGGLLVAATVNQRPDLFGAAVAHVGVMDIVRFNKFPAGESWTSDFGNPENSTQFENLYKFSPLHNVGFPGSDNSTQYPATLLYTADHDDRVVPSHSYKLIAEMQYRLGRDKRQTNPLFLLVQLNAGHGGGKPMSKQIDEYTDSFSFMCTALGLNFTE